MGDHARAGGSPQASRSSPRVFPAWNRTVKPLPSIIAVSILVLEEFRNAIMRSKIHPDRNKPA